MVGDAKGRGVFELRAKPDSTEMDSLNVSETGRTAAHKRCHETQLVCGYSSPCTPACIADREPQALRSSTLDDC